MVHYFLQDISWYAKDGEKYWPEFFFVKISKSSNIFLFLKLFIRSDCYCGNDLIKGTPRSLRNTRNINIGTGCMDYFSGDREYSGTFFACPGPKPDCGADRNGGAFVSYATIYV